MIAMHLLLLGAIIAVAATRLLPKARWVYQAPGLGLAAWHAVLAGLLVSMVGAAVSLAARWPATQQTMCAWWALCVDTLSGELGPVGRAIGWLAVAAALALGAHAARTVARALRNTARTRRDHRDLLTIIGRHDARLDAIVLDCDQPAAYLLPGRDPQVVITRGALHTLPDSQVAAILAHERAHATGRHHLLLGLARMLADAFPSVGVFADAHRQIDRLVELHADDIAIRSHNPLGHWSPAPKRLRTHAVCRCRPWPWPRTAVTPSNASTAFCVHPHR